MAKFVVEADAGVAGKFVGQERSGLGAEVLQDLPAEFVQFLGGFAGLCKFAHGFERGSDGFARLLHSDQF